ncbi:RhuM family protein [Parafrigoribacterium mesophilum]|uniref:RhuM family protein n=1 Tax=Parafrigoribacterium mesophilum TaxID=433646 RepID=UPI0031FDBD2D
MSEQKIVVYEAPGVELRLPLDRERETVWATQAQIVELFGIDLSGVSRHIRNVFRDSEVDEPSNLQKMQIASSDRPVTLYSLDVILAVGYRANSSRAITFRRWATAILKQYILEGVAVNEHRLEQLGSIVRILSRSSDELVAGVAGVLAGYLPGLQLLRDYDAGQLNAGPGAKPDWTLTIEEARSLIAEVRNKFPEDALFGQESGGALEGIVASIYQGFADQEFYPTVEQKAANLLYLVVKDHPLSDGNKRSAAALFVTFLSRNGILMDAKGQPRISNNALAAITLMVAMSDPKEKELMVALVVRMLSERAQ